MKQLSRPVSLAIVALAAALLMGAVLLMRTDAALPVLAPTAAETEPQQQPSSTEADEPSILETESEPLPTQTHPPQPVVYPPPSDALLAQVRAAVAREQAARKSGEAVLTFTGDCTLGTFPECPAHLNFNSVYAASGSLTYPFDLVKGWFEADDYTVVNLETALTNATKAQSKEWRFKGPPAYAGMLRPAGIEAVTLENNHSRDYFEVGYQETRAALTGHQVAMADTSTPLTFQAGGIEFVLLNYDCRTYRQETIGDELIAQYCAEVKQHKKPDNIVIVAMHWGVEYRENPESYQTDYARRMVEAGADLIVGHHPHQLQGIEKIGESYVVYSLGNFAFGGNENAVKAARQTMMVRPRFTLENGVARCTGLSIVPCLESSAPDEAVNNYRPLPLFGSEAQAVRDRVLRLSARLPNGVDSLECYN